MRLPTKEETRRKRDGSLAFAVNANEAFEGGNQKSAIQQDSEQVRQLSTEAIAVESKKNELVDTSG